MKAWWERWLWNLYPCYFFTGARVRRIDLSAAWVRVELPLTWRTRNIVGTLFGGFLYAAADPIFMVMLRRMLGPDYVVWDKAASIDFVHPGRTRVTADFRIPAEDFALIREAVDRDGRTERHYPVEWVDASGVVVARLDKTVWIGSLAYVKKRALEKKSRSTDLL